jgi:hypothetical protein
MSCSYPGRSCGSRFGGYPCTSGPPIFDSNNNVVPKRTVLSGTSVCTKEANFRDYVSVGRVESVVDIAEVDIFGNQNVYGSLSVDPSSSPTLTAGISLAKSSTFEASTDLNVNKTTEGSVGSLVFQKAQLNSPDNPSQGGRLDVIFYDPSGQTGVSGFLYTASPSGFYLSSGTGIYNEEKWGPSLAQPTLDVASPINSSAWGCLTTTVLSSLGAQVMQAFQGSNGYYGRKSDAATGQWLAWRLITAW